MKHVVLPSFFVVLCLVVADAQTQRPEPGEWWGSSPGMAVDELHQILVSGDGLVIVSAPLGETPASEGPIVTAPDGTIEFHRAGDPAQLCTLKRSEHGTYVGSCRGSVTSRYTLAKRGNPGGLEVPVDDKDLLIVARARQILSGPSVWNRHDDRVCGDAGGRQSWSLYCALYQASVEVTGVHQPVRPVMQEARIAILEVTHRAFQGALKGFNNLESTNYAEVVKVFDLTEQRLRTMKARLDSTDARTFAGFPSAAMSGGGRDRLWAESIGHTVNGQSYILTNILGPMDKPREVWEDWLARSTSVKRRSLPSDWRNAIDAKGTFLNGLQWRHASFCGEAMEYQDVPADVAEYFDRIIDSAYFRVNIR